ncbi:MAG: hypothetical protein H8D56_07445 [Planctomycetes bacterium]|nr:hypothetical protein [Planctomycetota bacterium]
MENINREEISKRYFQYLKHLSTFIAYFILFLLAIHIFKVSKYAPVFLRLAIPFVISSVVALALMAGLSFYADQATFIERHHRLLEIGFVASTILFIFGLVNTVVFFMQH